MRGNEFEDDQVTDCSFGNEINTGDNSFSSRHIGGANFLIGDGSVRLISDEIESHPPEPENTAVGMFQKLSHINDGTRIGRF